MHGDRAKPAPRRAEPRGTGTPSCGRGGGVWIRPWTGHCGQPTGSPLHSNQPEWAFLSRATPKTRLTGTTPRPHPHAAEGTPREAGAPREGARRRGPSLCVLGPAGKGGSPGCGGPDPGGGRGPRPGAWAAAEAPRAGTPTPTSFASRIRALEGVREMCLVCTPAPPTTSKGVVRAAAPPPGGTLLPTWRMR